MMATYTELDFVELARHIHKEIEAKYGVMAPGIRTTADLERVKSTAEAAETILNDHPFFDGNKRTSIVMFELGDKIRRCWPDIHSTGQAKMVVKDIIEEWDWLLKFLTNM